jgi:flagellar protein FlbD
VNCESEDTLITLSRLNGSVVAINPDLITWIDVTPDTTVSLLGGDKIIVREPLEEVIGAIIEFRRAVSEWPRSVSEGTLRYLHQHPERTASQRQSSRPPGRGSVPPPRSIGPNRT